MDAQYLQRVANFRTARHLGSRVFGPPYRKFKDTRWAHLMPCSKLRDIDCQHRLPNHGRHSLHDFRIDDPNVDERQLRFARLV